MVVVTELIITVVTEALEAVYQGTTVAMVAELILVNTVVAVHSLRVEQVEKVSQLLLSWGH